MWVLILTGALAATIPSAPSSASTLPTADRIEAGHGQVYLQPGISLGGLDEQVGAAVGLTDRLALSAGAGIAGLAGQAGAGLRYNVVQTEHFRLAPWVSFSWFTMGSDAAPTWGPTLGVALEGGGPKAWFDLSVPAVTWNLQAEPGDVPVGLPLFFFTRIGGTYAFSDHHRMRVGMDAGLTPTVDASIDVGPLTFGGGVSLVNLRGPGIHALAALRF